MAAVLFGIWGISGYQRKSGEFGCAITLVVKTSRKKEGKQLQVIKFQEFQNLAKERVIDRTEGFYRRRVGGAPQWGGGAVGLLPKPPGLCPALVPDILTRPNTRQPNPSRLLFIAFRIEKLECRPPGQAHKRNRCPKLALLPPGLRGFQIFSIPPGFFLRWVYCECPATLPGLPGPSGSPRHPTN